MESDQPKQDADLNLVYRAKFLGNVVRKLREEGIKVGYHIFVALQDLNAVRGRPSLTHGKGKAYLLERALNITIVFMVNGLGRESGNRLEVIR